MEPFIGTVCLFAFSIVPRGWAICDGRLLSIASNSALFALLGTTYGGDGVNTFALPDLRGRVPEWQRSGAGAIQLRNGAGIRRGTCYAVRQQHAAA